MINSNIIIRCKEIQFGVNTIHTDKERGQIHKTHAGSRDAFLTNETSFSYLFALSTKQGFTYSPPSADPLTFAEFLSSRTCSW